MNTKFEQEIIEKVSQDYDKIAEEFDKTRQYSWKEFEKFKKYIKDNEKLADLGCGNGRLLDFLKKEGIHTKYTGIDNSKKLLEKARAQHRNEKFIKEEITKTSLHKNSQDTVTAIASIHHLPSKKTRQKALEEIARILKPEGYAIITNWNLYQKKYKKYIWKARIRSLYSFGRYSKQDTFIPWGKSGVKRYYYAFKKDELEELLPKNLKIIEKSIGNNLVYICQKTK